MVIAGLVNKQSLRRRPRKTVSGLDFELPTPKKASISSCQPAKLQASVEPASDVRSERAIAHSMRKNRPYKTVYSTVTQGPWFPRKTRKTVFTSKNAGFSSKMAGRKPRVFALAEKAVFPLISTSSRKGRWSDRAGSCTVGIRKIG